MHWRNSRSPQSATSRVHGRTLDEIWAALASKFELAELPEAIVKPASFVITSTEVVRSNPDAKTKEAGMCERQRPLKQSK